MIENDRDSFKVVRRISIVTGILVSCDYGISKSMTIFHDKFNT